MCEHVDFTESMDGARTCLSCGATATPCLVCGSYERDEEHPENQAFCSVECLTTARSESVEAIR